MGPHDRGRLGRQRPVWGELTALFVLYVLGFLLTGLAFGGDDLLAANVGGALAAAPVLVLMLWTRGRYG